MRWIHWWQEQQYIWFLHGGLQLFKIVGKTSIIIVWENEDFWTPTQDGFVDRKRKYKNLILISCSDKIIAVFRAYILYTLFFSHFHYIRRRLLNFMNRVSG